MFITNPIDWRVDWNRLSSEGSGVGQQLWWRVCVFIDWYRIKGGRRMTVKIRITSGQAALTDNWKENGVPQVAYLNYRNGSQYITELSDWIDWTRQPPSPPPTLQQNPHCDPTYQQQQQHLSQSSTATAAIELNDHLLNVVKFLFNQALATWRPPFPSFAREFWIVVIWQRALLFSINIT